jgi:UDP-glucose 4-epimerase
LPINEKDFCKPLSPYGFHKRNAEIICEEFTKFYQIQTCNLRIFSAYGNGLKKQLFWDISQKAKSQKSISLFGTGLESRDFIHIKDIVKAIELVLKNGDFNNGIYNVGNGVENRIKDLATILLEALNWKGELSFTQENRIGDPINWCADISALKLLGYQQTVKLNEGLIEYAKWVKG